VRKKVEEEARRQGSRVVTMDHVRACQRRFMDRQEEEVRGYRLELCFSSSGCPKTAYEDEALVRDLEGLLADADLRGFLKSRIDGPLKMHHEFKVVLSGCPNGCSRPHIADIGLLGATTPRVTEVECSGCGGCEAACEENAITAGAPDRPPVVDPVRCLGCGQCIAQCPTGTLEPGERGFRIVIGGKLGRHPRLAEELPGIYTSAQCLAIVQRCIEHFKAHFQGHERFGAILERTGTGFLDDLVREGPVRRR